MIFERNIYSKEGSNLQEHDHGNDGNDGEIIGFCGIGCNYDRENSWCDVGGTIGSLFEVAKGICRTNYIEDVCPEEKAVSLLANRPEQALIDFTLSYQFRDSFMNQYQFTRNYIGFYYSIGPIICENLTLPIAIKTATTFNDFANCMNMLLNASDYADEVLINDELKFDLISLVNDYKSLSNEEYYQNVLSTVENDINTISNMTVQAVINNF
jgi:hypothetical protein